MRMHDARCIHYPVTRISHLTSHTVQTTPTPLRAGIIGCDTSHAVEFTKILNDRAAPGSSFAVRATSAFPGGSADLPESVGRLETFTSQLRGQGIEIVDSIAELLQGVDVVLLLSLDGRQHVDQATAVIQAGKPVFIDKPLGASLCEAIHILQLATAHSVPCFSSSLLRFAPNVVAMRNDADLGQVLGCTAYGPCRLEPHHPDLFFYGIHIVEMLLTIMGTGCARVSRVHTEDTDVVTGTWHDSRVGTIRGLRAGRQEFGAVVYGSQAIANCRGFTEHAFGSSGIDSGDSASGYQPLVAEIARFFHTGNTLVSLDEMLEVFAFMEAANESRRQGGVPVELESVLATARKETLR